MGCVSSTQAVRLEPADWPEDVKNAVKDIEGWENEKALEAAKEAAATGKDKDAVMEAANNAKSTEEEGEEEEGDKKEGGEEGEKQETAPEENPAEE